jgi:hypothetical protein
MGIHELIQRVICFYKMMKANTPDTPVATDLKQDVFMFLLRSGNGMLYVCAGVRFRIVQMPVTFLFLCEAGKGQ